MRPSERNKAIEECASFLEQYARDVRKAQENAVRDAYWNRAFLYDHEATSVYMLVDKLLALKTKGKK